MRLVRIPHAFDHPDLLWEIKHDGFRAIADVRLEACTLTSRNGYVFKHWQIMRRAPRAI